MKTTFEKIKKGEFFHMKGGKTLWQKTRNGYAQGVNKHNIGSRKFFLLCDPVIAVNARIVEDK